MRVSQPPARDAQQQRQTLRSLIDEANKGVAILEQCNLAQASFSRNATGYVTKSDEGPPPVIEEAIAILQSSLANQETFPPYRADHRNDGLSVSSVMPQIVLRPGDVSTPLTTERDIDATTLGYEIAASIRAAFEHGIESFKMEQEHFLEQVRRASGITRHAHAHTGYTKQSSQSEDYREGGTVHQNKPSRSEHQRSQDSLDSLDKLPKSVQKEMDKVMAESAKPKRSTQTNGTATSSRATYHLELMNQQITADNRLAAANVSRCPQICPNVDTTMFAAMVESRSFNLWCFVMMLAFAIVVGVESELTITAALENRSQPTWPVFTDIGFNMFFAIEVTIRLLGERSDFFCGKDWKWNIFDLFLAVLSFVDMLGQSTKLSYFRIFRTMKLLKALKVVRTVRWFHELRVMLTSVLASLASLFWTMIFLAMTTFLTSVAILQGLTDFIREEPDLPHNRKSRARIDIENYFPHVGQSMYTLLAAITGGTDWVDPAYPCWKAGTFYGQILMAFVLISVLGILNVVTSMFVEQTANLKKMDRDFLISEQVAHFKFDMKETLALFKKLDPDNKAVTRDALLEFLKEDQIIAHFATIGIDVSDQDRIACLLDENADGYIEIVEFVSGCIALKGSSNKVDAMMTANLVIEVRERLDIVHEEVRLMRSTLFPSSPSKSIHMLPQSTSNTMIGTTAGTTVCSLD